MEYRPKHYELLEPDREIVSYDELVDSFMASSKERDLITIAGKVADKASVAWEKLLSKPMGEEDVKEIGQSIEYPKLSYTSDAKDDQVEYGQIMLEGNRFPLSRVDQWVPLAVNHLLLAIRLTPFAQLNDVKNKNRAFWQHVHILLNQPEERVHGTFNENRISGHGPRYTSYANKSIILMKAFEDTCTRLVDTYYSYVLSLPAPSIQPHEVNRATLPRPVDE